MADWITTREAAEISGYNRVYLYELIQKHRIKAQRFGPVWQIDRQSLQTYLQQISKSVDKRHGARKTSKRRTSS
ncbi:MAG: helix-turn-helix domain-containing protein [Anaerolineae bacterium]|nr:helix-turn-helix domain-containing protein [Anaerolineae bacterium]